jgi:transcriptional regulator with XRE-family HTH domain
VIEPSPTVRRRRLGIELRRLREAAGVTIDEVAEQLECSASKVSRIETGKTAIHRRDVRDMLDMYRVTDEAAREELFALARDGQRSGWWAGYAVPEDFEIYVGLEAEASLIRALDMNVVHGLFQTEDYARAIYQAGRLRESLDEIEKQVALRMRRQEVLTRNPRPLEIRSVHDEAAIRRRIGGPAVMRAQLDKLVEVADLPNVTIQVMPFAKGAYAWMGGSFSLIELSTAKVPSVLYVESAGGNMYVERKRDLDHHARVFAELQATALPPAETLELLRALSTETI